VTSGCLPLGGVVIADRPAVGEAQGGTGLLAVSP
jgi:hypothetical protein